MTDRPLPAPRPPASPTGFERELERAERYAASALAASTRKAYEADWRVFAQWCATHALSAIPAAPATVGAFLAVEADRGFRPVTIGKRAAAIAAAHRAQNHPNPCDSAAAAAVMAGIRREHGVRPLRQAKPLETEPLSRLLEPIDADTLARPARPRVAVARVRCGAAAHRHFSQHRLAHAPRVADARYNAPILNRAD
jgi:hypothetical protein